VEDSAAETPETQANGRFRPGESGNPAGRPKGAKNKATLLAEEGMQEKVGAVVDKLVERALAGSTSAIRQFLDRTMPMPRGCIGFDLPDLRGPRGIADAQEELIIAVAARQVPARDAEQVMNLIDRFKSTPQTEKNMARYAEIEAEREQQAAAKVAPLQDPAPAAVAQDPATAAPDLAAYARMDWPQLIDAMWDAEEAERKAAPVPAETASAEAQAADDGAGDPDPDGLQQATAAAADANHDIYREIQVGDANRPLASSDQDLPEPAAGSGEPPAAAVVFDETVPPPYVDMSGQASIRRFRAAQARQMEAHLARPSPYARR